MIENITAILLGLLAWAYMHHVYTRPIKKIPKKNENRSK